jgi:hypothetical protein
MSGITMAINGRLEEEAKAIEKDFRKLVKVYEEAQVFSPHKLALLQAVKNRLQTYDATKCLEIIKHASPEYFNGYLEPLLDAAGRVLLVELSSKFMPQDEREGRKKTSAAIVSK